jgi:hypothetical protein
MGRVTALAKNFLALSHAGFDRAHHGADLTAAATTVLPNFKFFSAMV